MQQPLYQFTYLVSLRLKDFSCWKVRVEATAGLPDRMPTARDRGSDSNTTPIKRISEPSIDMKFHL